MHLANMAGLTGIDWRAAPLKWQALDILYLALDLAVVVWLPRARRVGVSAFFAAALSQIALYTIGRAWITDVPAEVDPGPDAAAYLDGLVLFHVLTIIAVAAALAVGRRPPGPGRGA